MEDELVHSRQSSGCSIASAAVASTCSGPRSHRRFSSSSSVYSAPDSPAIAPLVAAKRSLGDLVEEPAELDDESNKEEQLLGDDCLCICDQVLCVHQQCSSPVAISQLEDDLLPVSDLRLNSLPTPVSELRQDALPIHRSSPDVTTSRWNRHLPSSLSRKLRGTKTAPPSAIATPVRSAPVSRASSVRPPHPPGGHVEAPPTPPLSPEQSRSDMLPTSPSIMDVAVSRPKPMADPIDRQANASTPLLPPFIMPTKGDPGESPLSPLQSPSIATGTQFSFLSPKTSNASFGEVRQAAPVSERSDYWAAVLGHANFHIQPEPYMPAASTLDSLRQLLSDWDKASVAYMIRERQIDEHHGSRSQVLKHAQEKWAEINAQWRAYYNRVEREAAEKGEIERYKRTPADQQSTVAAMPTLVDPKQPSKFPLVNEADVVGPMVKYTTRFPLPIAPSSPKRTAFVRLLTDRSTHK
ncbi:hypothetical protein K470DRAFT_261456 [Piedraia hortae CBS 480.64]|uniref:Uncharacterized protein n=1 Tax=Piedraia hortae CBS 480.64 TaxID=1314780 RepID=A0A6A7C9K9_9PEZI|nr:hypothetical protein K470DRAFT_261456 [Piedraia hortae CBS 480.64]